MPTTLKLKLRTKDAEKVNSRIFSTEDSPKSDRDIVDSIYFKRPFANSVKEITLTIVRDIDTKLDNI